MDKMALCFGSGAGVPFLMKSRAAHCWRLSGRKPACLASLQGLRGDPGIIQEPTEVSGEAIGQCHYLSWTLGTWTPKWKQQELWGQQRGGRGGQGGSQEQKPLQQACVSAAQLYPTLHGIWAEQAPNRCLPLPLSDSEGSAFLSEKGVKVFHSLMVLNLGHMASK